MYAPHTSELQPSQPANSWYWGHDLQTKNCVRPTPLSYSHLSQLTYRFIITACTRCRLRSKSMILQFCRVCRRTTPTVCNAFKKLCLCSDQGVLALQCDRASARTSLATNPPACGVQARCHRSQSHLLRHTGLSRHRYQPSIVIKNAAIKHCSAFASTVISIKLLQELVFHCCSCSVEPVTAS